MSHPHSTGCMLEPTIQPLALHSCLLRQPASSLPWGQHHNMPKTSLPSVLLPFCHSLRLLPSHYRTTLPALPLPARAVFLARRYLGLGSYAEWDEEARLAFLEAELGGKRPLIPPSMPFSPDAREVMDTLRQACKHSDFATTTYPKLRPWDAWQYAGCTPSAIKQGAGGRWR